MSEMSDSEDRLKQPRNQKLLPFMSAVLAASSVFIALNRSGWSSFDQRFSWIPAPIMIAGCAGVALLVIRLYFVTFDYGLHPDNTRHHRPHHPQPSIPPQARSQALSPVVSLLAPGTLSAADQEQRLVSQRAASKAPRHQTL
jgi:hypothetical protein